MQQIFEVKLLNFVIVIKEKINKGSNFKRPPICFVSTFSYDKLTSLFVPIVLFPSFFRKISKFVFTNL